MRMANSTHFRRWWSWSLLRYFGKFAVVGCAILLVACGAPGAAQPAATPAPTATVTPMPPTATLTPAPPTPTFTPIPPSSTPAPTATITVSPTEVIRPSSPPGRGIPGVPQGIPGVPGIPGSSVTLKGTNFNPNEKVSCTTRGPGVTIEGTVQSTATSWESPLDIALFPPGAYETICRRGDGTPLEPVTFTVK